MHGDQRRRARTLHNYGKTIILGAYDRQTGRVHAHAIDRANRKTLQRFVQTNAGRGATVYTDSASAYVGIPFHHEALNHSIGEYVSGDAWTNGIESFWAMTKRIHKGTYHHWSRKHNDRYMAEFAGRWNARDKDTIVQMEDLVASMEGHRLTWRDLTA